MHLVGGQDGAPLRAVRERPLDSGQSFDALMRLADWWQERWERRRHFEWTLSFAIWAIMAVALVCAYCSVTFPVALPALVVLAQGYIVSRVQWKNIQDDRVVLRLRRQAEALTRGPQSLPEEISSASGWRAFAGAIAGHAAVAQIAPTALAAFILTEKFLGS